MLASLGFAALFGIVGTFAAILWAAVIAVAGVPGSSLMRLGTRHHRRSVISAGTVLSSTIELYLLLAFAGVASRFVAAFLLARPALPGWPLWITGWYLATAPVLFSGWNLPGAQARDERDVALGVALPAAALGYWLFVTWPGVLAVGWPWIPVFKLPF